MARRLIDRTRRCNPLLAAALVALASCGGDDGDAGTNDDGATVTAESTVEPGATTAPSPADTATSEPPSGGAATTEPGASDLYRVVDPPRLVTTDPIDPAWIEANGETLGSDIADGVYWGELVGTFESGKGPGIWFELSQVFVGDDCVAQFGTGDDVCLNDYQELPEPHGELPAFVESLEHVSVANVIDSEVSYLIDGAELYRMANGKPPSAGAPEYWALAPFPYLVTVRNGTITKVEQVWLP